MKGRARVIKARKLARVFVVLGDEIERRKMPQGLFQREGPSDYDKIYFRELQKLIQKEISHALHDRA